MKAIHGFDEKVAGVVRAIDEAAFRTDLLALSAAVEAARAHLRAQVAQEPAVPSASVQGRGEDRHLWGIAEQSAAVDSSNGLAALRKSLRPASSSSDKPCHS